MSNSKASLNNYYKIKNMKTFLDDENKTQKIHLKSVFTQTKLRNFTMQLNRKRTIGCYFCKAKCVYLELFDSNGQSIKIRKIASNLTYFPLVASNSQHVVIYYTAKPKLNHLSRVFDDSSTGYVSELLLNHCL